jgi:hypothetical protein
MENSFIYARWAHAVKTTWRPHLVVIVNYTPDRVRRQDIIARPLVGEQIWANAAAVTFIGKLSSFNVLNSGSSANPCCRSAGGRQRTAKRQSPQMGCKIDILLYDETKLHGKQHESQGVLGRFGIAFSVTSPLAPLGFAQSKRRLKMGHAGLFEHGLLRRV